LLYDMANSLKKGLIRASSNKKGIISGFFEKQTPKKWYIGDFLEKIRFWARIFFEGQIPSKRKRK